MRNILLGSLFLFACGGSQNAAPTGADSDLGPCHAVSCSNHGDCAVLAGEPVCLCDQDYHAEGLACIYDAGSDACEGESCGGNGVCVLVPPDQEPACLCSDGYEAGTDGLSCDDVDECAPTPGPCDTNASCANLPGGYDCVCNQGYSGNGESCTLLPPAPHVLVVVIDGLRPGALSAAATSVFDGLAADALVSMKADAGDVPMRGPAMTSMLTAVWRDKHLVDDDIVSGADLASYPALTARLETARPELTTAWIGSWDGLSTLATQADEPSLVASDALAISTAVARLGNASADVDLLLVQLGGPVEAGMANGFDVAPGVYLDAIVAADTRIGQLTTALTARPSYDQESWLIIVAGSHGGGSGFNLPGERDVPVLVHGPPAPGVIFPDPGLVDIAPTVLNFFGVPVQPVWGLDGQALLAPSARPAASLGANLLYNPGAEHNRGFASLQVDGRLAGWRENSGVTPIAYGSPDLPSPSDLVPLDVPGAVLFAGGQPWMSSLTQQIDITGLSTTELDFALSGYLGGSAALPDQARVVLRLDVGAPTAGFYSPSYDKLFFFRRGKYWRYDLALDTVDPGYPKTIDGLWDCLWADGIDAAVQDPDGETVHFFKGHEHIAYSLVQGSLDLCANQAEPITTAFPELAAFPGGAADIDAAVLWSDPTTPRMIFFKDGWYLEAGVSTAAQLVTRATWQGVEIWPTGIDMAVPWGAAGDLFLFKEGYYVRYGKATAQVAADYPRQVGDSTWDGLTDFYHGEHSHTIGPVTAADRGDATGLLLRAASGTVPSGTSHLEVELLLEGDNGHGYADNLSLVLSP